MNIHILGTGNVARTLAARIKELGHDVTLKTRSVDETITRNLSSDITMQDWLNTSGCEIDSFESSTGNADLLINACNGKATLEMLALVGAENLKDKVLLDLSNPLDFSNGMPPTLFVCNDNSLAEQIQNAYPETLVVKSLNTLTASLMLNPGKLDGDHVVFLSGNDSSAKDRVKSLEMDAGWHPDNIIDLGDITTARGTEQWLPLWVRLWGSLGTANFNLGIVR